MRVDRKIRWSSEDAKHEDADVCELEDDAGLGWIVEQVGLSPVD